MPYDKVCPVYCIDNYFDVAYIHIIFGGAYVHINIFVGAYVHIIILCRLTWNINTHTVRIVVRGRSGKQCGPSHCTFLEGCYQMWVGLVA